MEAMALTGQPCATTSLPQLPCIQPAQQCWRALQEVQLLGEAAGLTLAATYGELDTDIALADEEAFRLVACLQRPLQGGPSPQP